ncbi:hypothetical protein FACS1894147_00990 [Spirochaetia bacterium]|nr:hypothetical protein FACS1894147_00990 [Spirochaetia bacterium]
MKKIVCVLMLLFTVFSVFSQDFEIRTTKNGEPLLVFGNDYIFMNCTKLESREFIRKNIQSIRFYSHSDDEEPIPDLTSIEIIPYACFADNTKLTSIRIPNGVKRIEARAFYGCTDVTEITFAEESQGYEEYVSLEFIGESAFSHCDLVEIIKLPNSLKYLTLSAFNGSEGFYPKKIWIGNDVEIDTEFYGSNGFSRAYEANHRQAGWYEFNNTVLPHGNGAPKWADWIYLGE